MIKQSSLNYKNKDCNKKMSTYRIKSRLLLLRKNIKKMKIMQKFRSSIANYIILDNKTKI